MNEGLTLVGIRVLLCTHKSTSLRYPLCVGKVLPRSHSTTRTALVL